MAKQKRIGIELLDENLREMIQQSTVIYPVDTAFITAGANPDGRTYVRNTQTNEIYVWQNASWEIIGADDRSIDWTDVNNKPSTYAPSTHTHTYDSLTGKPATFAPSAHTHPWSEVTEKPTTYAPTAHTHPWNDVTGKPATYAPSAHTHDWTDLENVPTSFNPSSHTHTESDIIGLDKYTKAQTDTLLTQKANATHSHSVSDVANLQQSLDAKANTSHTHTTTQVTGLDTALAGKAPTSHTHSVGQITNLQQSLDAKVDKVTGKSLTSNDFTNEFKTKLENLSDTASVSYDSMLAAHNAHVNDADIHVTSANKITWNTVTQKADTTYVDTQLASKANNSTLTGHTGNSTIHVTQTDKDAWNAKSTFSGNYADLLGKPTSFTPSAHTHLWAHITDKPSTFAPSAHTHAYGDLTGVPSTFTPSAHTHTTTQVTGLDSALSTKTDNTTFTGHTGNTTVHITSAERTTWNGKADAGHAHAWAEITDKPTTFAPSTHTHAYSSLTGIPATFAPSAHTHTTANVTGLDAALSNKVESSTYNGHTGNSTIHITGAERTAWNAKSNFSGAYSALTGIPTTFTPSTHSHTTAQVTGLDTALSNKAPANYGLGENLSGNQKTTANNVGTGMFYLASSATDKPAGITDGALFNMTYDNNLWHTQIFMDWRTNNHYTRVKSNGVWSSWVQLGTKEIISATQPTDGSNMWYKEI